MKSRLFALVGLSLAPLLAAACHSSHSGASTPPGIYCHAMVAGEQVCYGYSNLDADEQTAVSDACKTSLSGTISGSCPSGEIGCCSITTAGYDTTECYYVGTVSELETDCNAESGKWSASGDNGTGPGSDGGTTTRPTGGDSSTTNPNPTPVPDMGGCATGQTQCPSGCVDEASDVNNCGSCGYSCPAGPSGTAPACSSGACTYACSDPQLSLCDADPNDPTQGQCVDLQSDTQNCGQCDNYCSTPENGTASCQNGSCQMACSAGEDYCNDECIPVTSDPSNCGACGVTCAAGTECSNGACVSQCTGGETYCGGSCTNTQTDNNNCGACGTQCTLAGSYCSSGSCLCGDACQGDDGNLYCCPPGEQCSISSESGCM